MKKTLHKIRYLILPGLLLLSFPFFTFAQFSGGVTACDPNASGILGSDFGCSIRRIVSLLSILYPILVSIAFIVFFWGLSQFILHSDNKVELENGKKYMFWGVIALFVLITFMTIIRFIAGDLGVGDNPTIPGVLLRTN
jgi:hypothetical protein